MYLALSVFVLSLLQDGSDAFVPGNSRVHVAFNKNVVMPSHRHQNHQKFLATTLIASGDSENKDENINIATVEPEDEVTDANGTKDLVGSTSTSTSTTEEDGEISDDEIEDEVELTEQEIMDRDMLQKAIQMAQSR